MKRTRRNRAYNTKKRVTIKVYIGNEERYTQLLHHHHLLSIA
jgi:hypothetical protein